MRCSVTVSKPYLCRLSILGANNRRRLAPVELLIAYTGRLD
jgi:hypothetical protein